MKRSVASESLFEFSSKRKTIKPIVERFEGESDEEDIAVGSDDEEWFEDPEDQEIIDDIEKIDLGNEIVVDDEDERVARVEDLDTNKTVLKQLKTIIDINKGKPDRDKNYVTFTLKGKPGDPIDGIPFDIKGNKGDTTIMFIRKGTKNVKMVPLKNIVIESAQPEEKYEMVRESLGVVNEWSEYENETEPDTYEDFLFKVANHLVQQWDQEVLYLLEIDEFPPESEDLIIDVVNAIDSEKNDSMVVDMRSMFEEGIDAEEEAEKIAMSIRELKQHNYSAYESVEEDEYASILKKLK